MGRYFPIQWGVRSAAVKMVATLLVTLGFVTMSRDAIAGISGSVHDFSGIGGEGCDFCHISHRKDPTPGSNLPLWNHEITTASFTLYGNSPTLDATDITQPDGASKMCLSCHDGTVAVDSFGGSTGTYFITGSALIGTDLSNDHPIYFTYDTILASDDGELHDPASTNTVLGGTIQDDLLIHDKMECNSCHNIHSNTPALLVIDNANSALCLTCHNK